MYCCVDTVLLSLEPREHSPAMGRICPKGDGAVAAALVRVWPRAISKGPGGGKGARGKGAKGQSATGKGDGKGDTGCGKGDLDGWSPSSDNSPSSPRYLCRCMCDYGGRRRYRPRRPASARALLAHGALRVPSARARPREMHGAVLGWLVP